MKFKLQYVDQFGTWKTVGKYKTKQEAIERAKTLIVLWEVVKI